MLLLDSEEVFALPKHSGGRTGVHIYSTGKSAALGGRERFLRAHFSVKCFVMFIEVLVSIPRSLFLCEYRAEMAVLYSLSYRHLADRDYPMIHEETRDLLGPFFFHCDKALVCSRAMSSKLCTFLCARKRGRFVHSCAPISMRRKRQPIRLLPVCRNYEGWRCPSFHFHRAMHLACICDCGAETDPSVRPNCAT